MLRQGYDRELQRLQDEVLALGSMVEAALLRSVELLKQRDLDGSRLLVVADRHINETRFTIEDEALTLIATQAPMAGDMRLLAAILEIITELERIGDYAKGIARINLKIGVQPLLNPLTDLSIMAEKAQSMLHDALMAFVDKDVESARAIPKRDDEIDRLYEQINRELIDHIMDDPRAIEQANLVLWAAHNLERTGDRVINLCERVLFMATGEMVELDSDGSGIEIR